MVKLIRFLGLVSQSIFLQCIHVVGLLAFGASFAYGWFKLPSWGVPIMAVAWGVAADKFFDVSDVTGLLDKAQKANERGGFLVVVYGTICIVGYLAGAYGRHHYGARFGAPAPKAPEPAAPENEAEVKKIEEK